MTPRQTRRPEDFVSAFTANFNSGAVDNLVAGYAPHAVLDLGGGNVFRGHDQIRQALGNLLAPRLPIAAKLRHATENGSQAIIQIDWAIEGDGPDGKPFRLGGSSIDVLDRQPDGLWLVVLDLPFGAATPAA